VERSAVNRLVVGSNPTAGAKRASARSTRAASPSLSSDVETALSTALGMFRQPTQRAQIEALSSFTAPIIVIVPPRRIQPRRHRLNFRERLARNLQIMWSAVGKISKPWHLRHLPRPTGPQKRIRKATAGQTTRHYLCFYRYHVPHHYQRCPDPRLCGHLGLPRSQSATG